MGPTVEQLANESQLADQRLDELRLDELRRLLLGEPKSPPPGRHELSDEAWELVKDLLPGYGGVGRRPKANRMMLNGMLWALRTGAPWRDLPEDRFGPWETVYSRFNTWRANGTLARVAEALVGVLDKQGRIATAPT
jgi:transposase